ncbi:MAG: 30S ribosomal protein S7 [Candidatus Pacearchaeota archaeon]|nr:30S ribosomal protein S7 [Candidatus Pacearchaeota archaeon]
MVESKMKIFGLYDTSEVKVEDFGLKRYINLEPKLIVKSHGRSREKFGKSKINIVERLINVLATPGHRGKKHKIMTRVTGKYTQGAKAVIEAFKLIEARTKENPVQVLVRAIEKASPRDEITTIEYGGARYPQAVDCSPLRRVNLALKNIVHGAHDKAFDSKKKIYEALANEIILASQGSNESFAITKKIEMEKQADSAR